MRKSVENDPCAEKKCGGNPSPAIFIELNAAPGSTDRGCECPHSDPDGQKRFVWGSTGAPIFGAGMDEKPEWRDRGINDAGEPGDGLKQCLHVFILL